MIALTDALKNDLKWPDTYLERHPEIGFAQEMLSNFGEITKSVIALKGASSKSEKSEKPDKAGKVDKAEKADNSD